MAAKHPLRDITTAANNSAFGSSDIRSPEIADSRKVSFVGSIQAPLSSNRSIVPQPHYMMPTESWRVPMPSTGYSIPKHWAPNQFHSSIGKRKNWVSSAPKRLGINSNTAHPPINAISRPQVTSRSAHSIMKRPDVPSSIPVKRPSTTPEPRSSPTPRLTDLEKPLPSLPVATIVSSSPVNRRSLIDATERPLRRSLSPQIGHVETEEWPALSPERPSSKSRQPEPIKPSVGESVIGGMAQLHLSDDPPNLPVRSDARNTSARDDATVAHKSFHARCSFSSSRDSSETSDAPNTSEDSVTASMAKARELSSKSAPLVRQTRTSAMRMRLSGGSVEGADLNFAQVSAGQNSAGVTRWGLPRTSPGTDLSHPGTREGTSARSASRGRHTATNRGSPYLIPSQSKAKLVEVKRKPLATPDTKCSAHTSRSGSIVSKEDARASKLVAVKSVKGSASDKRHSSAPLPSRLIRRFLQDESEGEIGPFPKPTSYHVDCVNDSHDADIDTEPDGKATVSAEKDYKIAPTAVQSSNIFSFSEMLNTAPPHADESYFSDDSSQGSVRGYDEDGGFKVKKLRKNGATLRISDAAHDLLSPNQDDGIDEELEDARKRNSTSDLHQAVMLKEHLRRSGERIMSQVQLSRSTTERSFARFSHISSTEDRSNEYVVPENAGLAVQDPSPVELPGARIQSNNGAAALANTANDTKTEGDATDTPSSLRHGDWPLKDFQTLASASKSTPLTDASMSPWIPPADWGVDTDQGDISVMSEGTQCPPVPYNTPATGAKSQSLSKTSRRLSNGSDRVATPTPIRQVSRIPQPGLMDPVKRAFPPRTTSKRVSSHHTPLQGPSILSPVKESPDRITGLRQPLKPCGGDLGQLQNPKNVKTFSESIEDVNKGFDAVRPQSAAKSTPHTISAKKPMSTLRNLFHKKSFEFRTGSRRAKKHDNGDQLKSSPLLRTPTPLHSSTKKSGFRMRGFSPLQSDIMTPATDRSQRLANRKPTPVAKCPYVNGIYNSSLEAPEIGAATETALKLLDMARDERPGERQNMLIELGKAMIEVVNAARDAEKALEQAKQAAAKAEMQALVCRKGVADVNELVGKFIGGCE